MEGMGRFGTEHSAWNAQAGNDQLSWNSQIGNHTNDQLTWNSQYSMGRKNASELSPGGRKSMGMVNLPTLPNLPVPPQPPLPLAQQQQQQPAQKRKPALFGDEDDETSMLFSQTMFRPDKENISQSPSQISSIGGNLYNPGNFGLQQRNIEPRSIGGREFPRNNPPGHITPTSIVPNFPIGLPQQQQASPTNRGMISAIGGQRSVVGSQQSNIQKPRGSLAPGFGSATSSITGMGHSLNFGTSRPDGIHPAFDLSEFPTLGTRSSAPSNPLQTARNYVGMVSKPATEQTAEFQIQQEDFPALPGSQNPPSSSANDSSRKTPTSSSSGSYEQAVSKDGTKSVAGQKRGIQTHPDGTVSNIPAGMVTDQFGIVGLLTFIRAAENDPNLVALAPGIDLTTLGLNLNSPENLYSTFQSPWADAPCRPQDIDFHVPAEYLTNIFIRDKLAPIKLNRYGEDLLFFLFYMNGGDVLQLAAAAELYVREWRYHKDERVWITRAPGFDPVIKTNSYERGTYYFFEVQNWRKVAKEFLLEYDKLEERPTLPPTLHHNPNNQL